MQHVFAIHNELGRFFDEKIYKCELARRMPNVRLEEPIDVSFGPYRAKYFIDVLVGEGAIFEFKSAESLTGRHRAQLLNYLLLCDLTHGKLVNLRAEQVEHAFVNTHWDHRARTRFELSDARWNRDLPRAVELRDFLEALLRDLGTGLEIALYKDAVTQCFGGERQVVADVPVAIDGHALGVQRMRLIAPGVAFKITALDDSLPRFENHARRLLAHTNLRAIAWINVTMKQVTFITLEA
ncbi:MAG TPA: GxxExxY protein [Pirellulales bacterium]|jgi:GxxExxY protein|nr:GxxExxY protein [Pirellulales bacterium]